MKKYLLAVTAALLAFTGTAFAQCPAGFTWAQSQPNDIAFTNTSVTQNPNYTYYWWDFGDNQTSFGPYASHTYNVPGSYVVCLNMYDSIAQVQCVFCDSITVTGNVICNVYASAQQTAQATCVNCADGAAIANVYNGTAPYAYAWSTGATTAGITNVVPGSYTVCVTDANGCTSCDTANVYWPNAAICGITWAPTTHNGGWMEFTASVVNFMQASTSVTWDFGDQSTGTGMNPWHQYQQAGSYAVCATVTDTTTQCIDIYCDTIVVSILTVPCDAVFFVQMDSVNTSQAWIYNMSTGSSSMTFQWWWGDNTSDTGAYPAHVYQNTGAYTICLIVVDQATQCTDTMCQSLWVPRLTQQAASAPFYVTVVPPVPAGVTAPAVNSTWSLYPNPVNSVLTIGGSFTGRDQYVITDLTGRTVATGTLGFNTIDVSGFAAGTFVFTVVKENGKVESKRFVHE